MKTVLMYKISHFLISLNLSDFKYYFHLQHKSSNENTSYLVINYWSKFNELVAMCQMTKAYHQLIWTSIYKVRWVSLQPAKC